MIIRLSYMDVLIRYAKNEDYLQIISILNQAIQSKQSTGFLNEFSEDDRKDWFHFHKNSKYPILIAELDNEVIGWISISPYRKARSAFEKTCEVSFFIQNKFHRMGIGNRLLQKMMIVAEGMNFSCIIAIVLEINTASIMLLKKNNFKKWAYLPKVAEIDGEKISHVYYGKQLQDNLA